MLRRIVAIRSHGAPHLSRSFMKLTETVPWLPQFRTGNAFAASRRNLRQGQGLSPCPRYPAGALFQLLSGIFMKLILLASSILLAASAVPAFAQDTAAPVSADAVTFGGPRAEIFGGWDQIGTRAHFDDGVTRMTDKGHKSGGTAGALLGYDMPIGDRFVVGAFGSYALSTARECGAVAAFTGCLKSGRQIEGGARVGGKVGGKTLLYLKGAYVNGQVRGRFTDGVTTATGYANRDGWRAGVGAEYALNQHAYLKVEYDYTRFKSFDATKLGLTDTRLRLDRNQVLGGFGIRF